MNNDTTSNFPGWWTPFLAAIITQAPRPGQIDQDTAEWWVKNQGILKKVLACTLCSVGNNSELFDALDKAQQEIEKLNKHDATDPEKLRKPIVW